MNVREILETSGRALTSLRSLGGRELERLAVRLSLPSLRGRIRVAWAWPALIVFALRERLARALPAVSGIERLLRRAGRGAVVLAFAASAALPLAVVCVRAGYRAWDRSRYLSYPPRWSWTLGAPSPVPRVDRREMASGFGVGGVSADVLPLRIMTYRARPGDTLSGVAAAFGLELDTVSALNRDWGNGVHTVAVGERLRIPNQDGIYLEVGNDFAALCAKYGLLPETVLAVNEIDLSGIGPRSTLFFPGVQHSGAMKEMYEGRGFFYPLVGWLSSGFGYRRDPFDAAGARRIHYGVDLVAPVGTPVRAARAGTVWLVSRDEVFGNQILIGHEFGLSTFYAHLDRVVVKPGQYVTQHSVIGYVGATGKVTGPHLHFEIRNHGVAINPSEKLTPGWY